MSKKKTESFDLETEIENIEKPRMFLEGLKEFLKANDVKNKKDFDKLVENYGKMNIGGE